MEGSRYVAIQISESTDVTNRATLLCFLHYMGKEISRKNFCAAWNFQDVPPGQRY